MTIQIDFKQAVDASADAIMITDPDGVIGYVNPAFTKITGLTEDEALGKTPAILNSSETPKETFQDMFSTLGKGGTWAGVVRYQYKSTTVAPLPIHHQTPKPTTDHLHWVHLTISPMRDDQGELVGYVEIQHDISDLVEKEEKQKRIQEDATARAAIARILQDRQPLKDRIDESLRHLMKLKGLDVQFKGGLFLTSPDQDHLELFSTVGEFSQEFYEKERSIPKGYCLCGRAAVSGELIVSDDCFCDPRHEATFQGMSAHGHYIVPLLHAGAPVGIMFLYTDTYPLKDPERLEQLQMIGELMGLAIANDRLNQRLETEKDRAESSNRSKSMFLANMSHEIRTPLNGILGFADLLIQLGENIDAVERADYLSSIQTSGKHLLKLINDILDLSKIESGRLDVEPLDCSPHALLSEVVSLMRATAIEKQLDLHYQWVGPLPRTVRTDPTRVRQMLLNLVGNSIKFTETGAVRMVAQLEERTDGTQSVRVDVIDSGIGIPEDKLQTIFESFSQADNSVTRKFGGTGLGLAISRRLAIALGGDLTVTSKVGLGSKFSVTIETGPLEHVEMLSPPSADAIAGRTALQVASPTHHVVPKARVLLVEDGEINRKLIIALLTQAGVESIDTAENGQIGVEKAISGDYDIILLDMQMPVMDGYAAATEMRNRNIDLPIVAMTAHAMKGDREKCIDAGCSDYLTKPIDAEKLMSTITYCVADSARLSAMEESTILSNSEGSSEQRSEVAPAEDRITSTLPIHNPVFLDIVQDFGELLPESMQQLRTAGQERDAERLAQLAHDLIGMAGGAGFGDFTEPSRQLEKRAREDELRHVMSLVAELEALASRLDIPARQTPPTETTTNKPLDTTHPGISR